MLQSLEYGRHDGQITKPRIQVLHIRHRATPDGDIIASLLLERHETHTVNNSNISLSYQRIISRDERNIPTGGCFTGSYSKLHNAASLISLQPHSRSAVFLDLPGLTGQRIGTYLLNEIVQWVKQWPDATIQSIELLPFQAYPENKDRRNRFYEQFGLKFDYSDPNQETGRSRLMLSKELNTVDTWKQNISEQRVPDYCAEILAANQEMIQKVKRLTESNQFLLQARAEAEAKPFWWILSLLYWRYRFFMAFSFVVACILCGAWLSTQH